MTKRKPQAARRARGGRRADPERLSRILVISAVVAVILVAIGFVAFGWYQTQVRPLGKTVLQVGDTKFSLAHLERRMTLTLKENTFFLQSPEILSVLADTVIGQLEEEGKLLEGAGELDITVTEEDVDKEIRERGGLSEDAGPRAFAAELRRQVKESPLHEDEYRQMIRAELLDEQVKAHFTELVPEREPQVHSRWIAITVDEEEKAQEALQRLEAGEDFAAVARDLSQDTNTAEEGGDLGWLPRGGFQEEDIEGFLFDEAEPGQRSEIITTSYGFFIVELLERDDNRELDDEQRTMVADREMNDWLDGLDETLSIESDLTEDDRLRALEDVVDLVE